jgi:hypothetical protein
MVVIHSCDVTTYAEMCLPSRSLETGCKTPLFHRCLARKYRKNSLIYSSMPGRVYGTVARQRVDQIRYIIFK